MELDFSADQEMLRQSFVRFLEKETSLQQVKEWIAGEKGYPAHLWKEMGNLGWLGLHFDEEYGGSNLGFLDLFILFEELGASLMPGPFLSSAVLSGMLVDGFGHEAFKAALLPPLVRGDTILTTGFLNERGQFAGQAPGVEAREGPDGTYRLSGVALLVPYAHVADRILCLARTSDASGGGSTLFITRGDSDNIHIARLDAVSLEKQFAVSFENALVSGEDIIGDAGKGSAYLSDVFDKVGVLKCGEMVGGMRRVLDMTVAYAKERRQFGRPLGSFQIVQHYCADMAAHAETSRLMARQAASLLSAGSSCKKEVAAAGAWCGEAYKKMTWLAHEIHGGIGFTEEYDLHLFYRHAKEAELLFGDARRHRSKVADEMGLFNDR
jgi:alkylation response protein AidB-like acyl-CoA dehydrogenase